MPGSLAHSPADVVRRLLIALGHGTAPSASGLWPIYHPDMPNAPDNAIVVRDTEGVNHGRAGPDAERAEHYGVQVLVRSNADDDTDGWVKANAVAIALDEDAFDASVTIGASTYCVYTINRTGPVIPLGKELPPSKRYLFSINALASIRQSA